MKANELMIGDWIRFADNADWVDGLTGKPVQVEGLCDDDGAIKVYDPRPNSEFRDFWSDDEDDFDPIPLTPEILEKNGFLRTPAIGERMCADDNYEIWVDFKKNKYWLNIKVSNDNKKENPVHYYEGYHSSLHELQMALKLCKIDKEIVL